MDFDWFRDLDRLAKTGNFSRAAELVNLSQPAFSRRIKALEAWVGAPLVDRGRHPIQLTGAGEQMLEAGRQAISRIEQERNHVREAMAGPDKYVVTFGAPHSISWRFYPAWLQAFEEAYGPLLTRLRADDLPICIEALCDGAIDFLIAYRSDFAPVFETGPFTESLIIGRDRLVPVSKTDSDGGPIFQFEDTGSLRIPWLRFGAAAPMSRHIDPLLEKARLRDRLAVVYENSMAGALRIRARDGAGVAWLPYSLVKPDIDAGLVCITGRTEWQIPMEVRIHRLRQHTNKLTREIWSFLSVRQSILLEPWN